jgi:high frequency lysogenization protein
MALAGIFQATRLVKQLAWEGSVESYPFQCSLRSLLKLDAESVADVYGEIACINEGLTVLRGQLGGDSQSRDLEITRYAATLLHLERKLSNEPSMLATLKQGIAAAQTQLEHFSIDHINIVSRFASLYQETISTLTPRVMVNGDQHRLNDNDTASRIRAMLLAGIRSAVLWRQCGGSRWKLILGRGALVRAAEEMLCQNLEGTSKN